MRQVSEAELVWAIKFRLSRLAPAIRNGFASKTAEGRQFATQFIAEMLVADALGKFEVLSDSPLPEGSDLFTKAAYGLGDGSAARVAE